MNAWNYPETPVYYEAFYAAHPRYRKANSALIAHAGIRPGQRILDLGAGTGRTAEAALERIGADGQVVCVEPSDAMRNAGKRRLDDPRLEWRAALPGASVQFHRVLCGAAIWQMRPGKTLFGRLARRLRSGGALVFNIPAAYLLEADKPGTGADPYLTMLPARLPFPARAKSAPAWSLTARAIEAGLIDAGLRPKRWSFRIRMTQDSYAGWMKIPVLTEHLFPGVPPVERAGRIEAALETLDRSSWKWERWRGWTAWK